VAAKKKRKRTSYGKKQPLSQNAKKPKKRSVASKVSKKIVSKATKQKRSLAAQKAWITRRKLAKDREKLKKKRSASAKKAWKKRKANVKKTARRTQEREAIQRKQGSIAWTRHNQEEIEARFHELEERLAIAEEKVKVGEEKAKVITSRYKQYLALDDLPPRMIQETALEHMIRIVKVLKAYGLSVDQSYDSVAQHTGVSPREVFTAFVYVGTGSLIAQG
jgi:hypothetical protein